MSRFDMTTRRTPVVAGALAWIFSPDAFV